MADPKGDYLYVNLSASQTRRRLKGFGHGVRKIQSGGKNQAVIIHTATGQHLSELERRFADVGYSTNREQIGEPIDNVRNLGPSSAAWLREVGIRTRSELESLGAAASYRMVKRKRPQASLNLLWAIAAGIQDRDWRQLTDDEKQRLLESLPP
ncbi:MAG: TfoX/Sxy family protein [Planctomycetaceae bacterium]